MDRIGPTFVIVVGSVITLAMIAVIVSKNANTPAVFTGAGTALSSVIAAAVAPVSNTGGAITGGTVPAGVTQ